MNWPLFLPCAAGVEEWLSAEVKALCPSSNPLIKRGGVALRGGSDAVMTLNLGSRLAQRVLIEVAHGLYHHEDDLYRLGQSVAWSEWIAPKHTLKVDTTAHKSPLRSLNFAALRIKDAVCDQLREQFGERPNVDTREPDLPLLLHLGAEQCTLYVDSSGPSLFKRGWREDVGEAPLKETLAAAMLAAAGWHGRPDAGGALYDPCCGSGTIAIEAAQIACGMAPGLKRRFAFERLLPFATPEQRGAMQRARAQAQARVHAPAVPIIASDVSFRMVDFARRNAQRAGVEHAIEFHGGDALERAAPALPADLPGTLMVNPPYGERIEVSGKAAYRQLPDRTMEPAETETENSDFFPRLASHWKRAYTQHPAGWTAYVLSPDMKLPGRMRLKESRRVPMWNGPIECRLFRFELMSGSARG